MHRDIWQDQNKTQQPQQQYGRILNRHKRGRPRNTAWQRLKNNARRRLVPPLVIGIFAVLGFFILRFMELI